eukprot:768666-Hanusia_phi.AAC.2
MARAASYEMAKSNPPQDKARSKQGAAKAGDLKTANAIRHILSLWDLLLVPGCLRGRKKGVGVEELPSISRVLRAV